MEAYISYIKGYSEHSLTYICQIEKLDLGQLAMSMGLLKLPVIRETKFRVVFRGERNEAFLEKRKEQ